MWGGGAENNARPRPPPPLAPRYRRSPAGSLSSLAGASGHSPSPKYLEVGVGGAFSCGPQRPRSAPPFRRPPHPHPPHAAATTTARTRTRRAGSSGWRAEAQGTRESGKTLGSPESQALSVQVEPSIASETDHW